MELSGDLQGLTEEDVLALLHRGVGPELLTGECAVLSGGDDAAVMASSGEYLVSTDTMIEGYDFVARWPNGTIQPAQSVAHKALAQNVSDINAMGGETTGLFLSLSMPPQTTKQWLHDFGLGIRQACERLGARKAVLAGGDLGAGPQIHVTFTVTGEASGGLLLRTNARARDKIYVCGNLGTAAAGLAHLLSSDESDQSTATAKQFFPVPPLWAGPAAAKAGANCGMDLSDGLVRDLRRILRASSDAAQQPLGAELSLQALEAWRQPLEELAQRHGHNPWLWLLNGGEDYALLVVAPETVRLPAEFTEIGRIVDVEEAGDLSIAEAEHPERTRALDALQASLGGWDHFA